MREHQPEPISATERRARIQRVTRIAHRLGFVGQIEYRHVYTRSGGAQYRIGSSAEHDLLVVYAEAFERDVDPNDFSLEAMIAHERGHQLIERDPNVRTIYRHLPSESFEEFLASAVGSLLVWESEWAQSLREKTTADLMNLGIPANSCDAFVDR